MEQGVTAMTGPRGGHLLPRGRRLAAVALTWAALAAAVALAAGSAPARAGQPLRRAALNNGLEVYVYEDSTVPLASVSLWYRVGSRDEPPGRRGMAHLLEHMMFKGSRQVPPEEHARLIQRVGGISNAFTTADATVYWNKVPAAQLELVFWLEADRMADLVLDPHALATEREVVKEEYRGLLQNNPIGFAVDRFHARMFASTPYAWTPAGAIEDLDRVTLADLQAFYRERYAPNNAVLVVAGAVTLEEVLELARGHFGSIPPRPVPPRPAVAFQAPRAGGSGARVTVERLELPLQLPGLIGGYAIPGARHPDRHALEVAAQVLAGGQASRLHRRLVRERRLAVFTEAASVTYQHAGAFFVLAFYLPGGPDGSAVLAALRQEAEGLAHEPPDEEELRRAHNQLAARWTFATDALDRTANLIGSAVVVEGDPEAFERGPAPYLAVTADDVQRVARTYLRADNLTVVSVVPQPAGAGPAAVPAAPPAALGIERSGRR